MRPLFLADVGNRKQDAREGGEEITFRRRPLEFGNPASLVTRDASHAQQPAHRREHGSDNVAADAARQVRVVASKINREELPSPVARVFCVMKRCQISFLDERGVVRPQAGGKRPCQQSVTILGIFAKPRFRQILCATELLLETCALSRVGFILFAEAED